MDFLNYNSVETLPGYEARAAFTVNSATVFREDVDIVPTIVDDTLSYVPWAATIKCHLTCSRSSRKTKHWQPPMFQRRGLLWLRAAILPEASAKVKNDVGDFLLDNDLAAYFLGICQDFKHFEHKSMNTDACQ